MLRSNTALEEAGSNDMCFELASGMTLVAFCRTRGRDRSREVEDHWVAKTGSATREQASLIRCGASLLDRG